MQTDKTSWSAIGLLVLRLGIGSYLVTHGYGKLQMVLAGEFEKFGDPIGLGNTVSLLLATGAEFFGSLLVMFGLLTRFAAASIVVTMAVAAFVVHGNDPWTMTGAFRMVENQPVTGANREPAMLFLIPSLALVFTGAGRYSLDALWCSRRSRSVAPEFDAT